MVAWHEVPGTAKASIRPVGYGVRGGAMELELRKLRQTLIAVQAYSNHTVPYGTDLAGSTTRHFMPGYRHFVPLGQGTRPELGNLPARSDLPASWSSD